MSDWPPELVNTRDIEWGVTPFDNLSPEDAKRMMCALYSAVSSCRSVLAMVKAGSEAAPFWSGQGTGGRALSKAEKCLDIVQGDDDERSEKIYRSFFRYADDLLFPDLDRDRWKICDNCKVMINPGMSDFCAGGGRYADECPKVMRPIDWNDLTPTMEE